MKTKILFSLVVISLVVFAGCKTKVKPTSDLVKKIWIIQSVKEGSTEVYKSGSTSNIQPGYGSYRLDLSAPPTVILKERDGSSFTGKYEITSSELNLTGLTPEPTGTGGNIEYSVTTATETSLVITNSSPNPKTGGTINTYSLVPAN